VNNLKLTWLFNLVINLVIMSIEKNRLSICGLDPDAGRPCILSYVHKLSSISPGKDTLARPILIMFAWTGLTVSFFVTVISVWQANKVQPVSLQ
jgi:hypothetical protein